MVASNFLSFFRLDTNPWLDTNPRLDANPRLDTNQYPTNFTLWIKLLLIIVKPFQ
jgi:hypothetical protein